MKKILVVLMSLWIAVMGLSVAVMASDPPDPLIGHEEAIEILINEVIKLPVDHDLIAFTLAEPLQPGDEIAPWLPHPLPPEVTECPHLVYQMIQNPTWFFWVDDAPRAEFAHFTRFVFVDAETGEVTVTEEAWWPVLNGESLWTEIEEYWNKTNWAYSWFEYDMDLSVMDSSSEGQPSPGEGEQPEKECAIVVNGWKEGESCKYFEVNKKGMADFFEKNGYNTKKINPPNNKPEVLKDAMKELKDCCDIVIYITSHGSVDTEGEPSVWLGGEKLTESTFCEWCKQEELRNVRFKVILQACYSGNWLDSLKQVPNVVKVITACGPGEKAYSAKPDYYDDKNGNGSQDPNESWDINKHTEASGSEFTSGLVEDLNELAPTIKDTIELLKAAFKTAVAKDETAQHPNPAKKTHPQIWDRAPQTVDCQPPENKPCYPTREIGEQNPDETYPVTIIDAIFDSGSGVKKVVAMVDGNVEFEADDIGLRQYEFSFVVNLYPGTYTLTIDAWDYVDHDLHKERLFIVEDPAPAPPLKPPEVPGMTGWGIIASVIALAGLMLIVVRRRGLLEVTKSR